VPHTIHDVSHRASAATGDSGLVEWAVNAIGGAIVGLITGGAIAAVVRRFVAHPEELVVD
jgi:predicted DNA repair protein MutK